MPLPHSFATDTYTYTHFYICMYIDAGEKAYFIMMRYADDGKTEIPT